jgi:DNA-binding MarR family transcriptional regulator
LPVTDTAATTTPNAGRARSAPTREQLAAWRAFLRAHASIARALEAELLAEQDLPLASYDVLVQLAEAPDRRLRMTELADAVLLSRSGVTRLVDRLEKGGLVARCPVENVGRGVAARLTDAGLDRLRTASRTHLRGVAHHFVNRLDESDLRVLERISRHLAG